ncbi:dispanin subfamily A member 2b [Callorhinchus milii]|uniref:Dispanin subfamily A member 2b-like n=1 Tax=Callorhinchus milii TaxID=7868 RepID=V9L8L5_CALMI|nr:dispanin subfamily A member 2b [Callorhinchus milii]|eukprot:gi/632973087/ref/XP_007902979.1/ PREDICTED: dispanin subfamily A member 2b-like [Callorhinchus milii]
MVHPAVSIAHNSCIKVQPPPVDYSVTIVEVEEDGSPVKDHFVWSIVSFVHFNFCCLGLWALIFSVKARDQKFMGNMNKAREYGSKAMNLNVTAFSLTVSFLLLLVYLITVCHG